VIGVAAERLEPLATVNIVLSEKTIQHADATIRHSMMLHSRLISLTRVSEKVSGNYVQFFAVSVRRNVSHQRT
jgi:hypothetical protein